MRKQFGGLLLALVYSVAVATGPVNDDERKMLEHLRVAYQKQGLTLTPEREEEVLNKMRKLKADMIDAQVMSQASGMSDEDRLHLQLQAIKQARGDNAAPTVSTNSSPSVDLPSVNARQLATEVAKQHDRGGSTRFKPQKDGFLYDDKKFVDPEGAVTAFGGDSTNGDVTYFVTTASGNTLVRYTNVRSGGAPISVGNIRESARGKEFASIDGTRIGGDVVIAGGRRVIVARGNTIFCYTLGGATTTASMPKDYSLAPYQQGDVASTNYVLLRRDIPEDESKNPLNAVKGIINIAKSAVGRAEDIDYAMFNVETGHTTILNIGEVGENVGHGTNCRRQNKVVNKCSGWESHAALYDEMGLPNMSHYYWRVSWMPTSDGPTAVVLENSLKDVDVIRLNSDQTANAFHRALGIQGFMAEPAPEGSLKVIGYWAFDKHVVDDVRTLFANPAQSTN